MAQSFSAHRQRTWNKTWNKWCDWIGCRETGFFDGVQKSLLNAEGRKNITETRRTFVFLCTKHFKLAVGSSEK